MRRSAPEIHASLLGYEGWLGTPIARRMPGSNCVGRGTQCGRVLRVVTGDGGIHGDHVHQRENARRLGSVRPCDRDGAAGDLVPEPGGKRAGEILPVLGDAQLLARPVVGDRADLGQRGAKRRRIGGRRGGSAEVAPGGQEERAASRQAAGRAAGAGVGRGWTTGQRRSAAAPTRGDLSGRPSRWQSRPPPPYGRARHRPRCPPGEHRLSLRSHRSAGC